MTREQRLERWVIETRKAQGLPAAVEDVATLDSLAKMVLERPGHESRPSVGPPPALDRPHRERSEREGDAASVLGGRPVGADLGAQVAPVLASVTRRNSDKRAGARAGGDRVAT
jgi:hypothetical protein